MKRFIGYYYIKKKETSGTVETCLEFSFGIGPTPENG